MFCVYLIHIDLDAGGITAESDYYPFDGAKLTKNQLNEPCQNIKKSPYTVVDSWEYVDPTDEELMKCLLASQGPLGISMNADAIDNYKRGILLNKANDCTATNHAVTIVGYGTDSESGLDYWYL